MIGAPKGFVVFKTSSDEKGPAAFRGRATWCGLMLGILALVVAVDFGWGPAVGVADQSPIYMTFDVHVDPVTNGFRVSGKRAVYEERTDNMVWVLEQTEPLDIPISFLSGGWYMEMLVEEGPSGEGAQVVRRMYG